MEQLGLGILPQAQSRRERQRGRRIRKGLVSETAGPGTRAPLRGPRAVEPREPSGKKLQALHLEKHRRKVRARTFPACKGAVLLS